MHDVYCYFCKISYQNEIVSSLQTIVLVFLTILLPIIIASLQDLFQKIGNEREDPNSRLHKNVLIDEVWRFPIFLGAALFSVFLPIFMESLQSCVFRVLFLVFWSFCIVYLFKKTRDSYLWIRDKKEIFIQKYQRRISQSNEKKNFLGVIKKMKNGINDVFFKKNDEKFIRFWRSWWEIEIWKDDDGKRINIVKEKERFAIFAQKIDSALYDGQNISFTGEALGDFLQFIDKRSSLFLVSEEVFLRFLKWHYETWKLENETRETIDYSEYGILDNVELSLRMIIETIEQRALIEGRASSFFHVVGKYTKPFEDKYKKSKDEEVKEYLESIPLQRVFFENIGKVQNKYDTEKHFFPSRWKVTLETLESGDCMLWIWLDEYMQWMRGKIDAREEKYDDTLNWVTNILFPNIHLIYFPYILVYILRSWMNNNRLREIIEDPPNFGDYYHPSLLSVIKKTEEDLKRERDEDWEKSKQYTFDLSLRLFGNQFTSSNIEEIIRELKLLEKEYVNDEEKKNQTRRLLEIFEGIYGVLEKKKKN
ncbi:MAG: hypothetical protein EOM19_06090 [Candidatus Moranbacteria bacterium]|nr:hypothetical protein [Candidatus Moranbacteria bacterium]